MLRDDVVDEGVRRLRAKGFHFEGATQYVNKLREQFEAFAQQAYMQQARPYRSERGYSIEAIEKKFLEKIDKLISQKDSG